jgi:hypothetical protein
VLLDFATSVDWSVAAHADRFVFRSSEADCATWSHLPGEPAIRVHAGAALRWELP